jgi:lipopolysaccharide transport system ATP-binding protein
VSGGGVLSIEDLGKRYWLAPKKAPRSGAEIGKLGWKSLFSRAPSLRPLWALRNVSLSVDPGTLLGIIGPNGSGKSTLLKIVARVTVPTEGRIQGRGRVVSLLEARGGFQLHMTGRDNVYMYAALLGLPRAAVDKKFDEIVDFADVASFIDSPVKYYSSGMQLRLVFSTAVNLEPEILLADEVLTVGDEAFQARCLSRIQEANRRGMTVLFVSHDMAAIRRLCHRAVVLNQGKVLADTSAAEAVRLYQNSVWKSTAGSVEGSHVNKAGELLMVRLASPAGVEIGAPRASEEFVIEVLFKFNGPGAVRFCLDAYATGTHAFRSVQAEEAPVRAEGVYSARVRVPARLLSPVSYTLNVQANFSDGRRNFPAASFHALSFNVIDDGGQARIVNAFSETPPGAVSPRLDWSIHPEDHVPQT